MRAWGLQLFGDIVHGASNDAQMTWLFERLDLAVYLTIAWTAGRATGRDFYFKPDVLAGGSAKLTPAQGESQPPQPITSPGTDPPKDPRGLTRE